jgi:hypothetical protein
MDDVVVCPNCGEANPADMPFCHNCQWRLRSLDADWEPGQGNDQRAGPQNPAAEDGVDSAVPEWLRLSSARPRPEQSADEAAAETLRERLGSQDAEDQPAKRSRPQKSEDLLAGLSQAEQPDDEPIPDWVARIMGLPEGDESDGYPVEQAADPNDPGRKPQSSGAAFSWGPGESPGAGGLQEPPVEAGTFHEGRFPAGRADTRSPGHESDDVYEWLRKLDAESAAPHVPAPRKDVPATTDVPTWVGRMMGVHGDVAGDAGTSDGSLPNWLETESPPEESPLSSHPLQSDAVVVPTESSEPPLLRFVPEGSTEPPPGDGAPPPMTTTPTLEETDVFDADAVFAAMQMPSWTDTRDSTALAESTGKPPAAHDDEPIEPADLPSWVRAMRPLESTVAAVEAPLSAQPREPGGPLLGLQGALPAVVGAALPSSRPKPHAVNLEVTDQHQAHARLLEEMLDAETRPLPLQAAGSIASPRTLRWVVAIVLLASLTIGLVSGTAAFRLPAGVPMETNAAIQVVQNLPPDAPVLTVFDYEPATAGEMEVTAAPIMDHLLLLKHPRLAILSTSPTGSALAERFISTTLHERTYARGLQYVDLGYLAGGSSGVQFFALDPIAALPYGAATDRVWESGILLGSTKLADFGAIIVLTDSLESGSIWIEQTTGSRGSAPMLVVASAQAGPMLLPYFDSGQVQGLVVGINGAAGTEIANGGRPGLVRRYWDAYNVGLYAAALLITLGTLWQGVSGLGRRRAETV